MNATTRPTPGPARTAARRAARRAASGVAGTLATVGLVGAAALHAGTQAPGAPGATGATTDALALSSYSTGCAWDQPSEEPEPTGEPTAEPTAESTSQPTSQPSTAARAKKKSWGPDRPADQVQIVHANIKSGMPIEKFYKDLRKVYKDCPDFVTLNEVPRRQDQNLAPEGYDLFRTPGQYEGETPVLWRTDKWSPVARGTTMISNKQGYGAGQSVMWGVRYANWVTLRSLDGAQTISVVSIHIAPKSSRTTKLLGPSIRRLGELASALSASGPVLVGGDFNRHYTSSEYPRAGLEEHGLNAVYDLSGFFEPTGDHRGATIDYVMLRPMAQFEVRRQTTRELKSDHDALVVDLGVPLRTTGERPLSFSAGTMVNDPVATLAQGRSTVTRTVLTALRRAKPGGSVRVLASEVSMKRVTRHLLKADRRGVRVRVISNSVVPTDEEQKIVERLADSEHGSWLRFRPAEDATASTVLVSRAATTEKLRLDIGRGLSKAMNSETTLLRSHTTVKPYKAAAQSFRDWNNAG